MGKRRVLISSLALLLTVTLLIVVIVRNYDYATVIAINWSIKLPRNYEIIYSVETEPSVFGDGPRYHVFYYQDGIDNSFLEDFLTDKNPGIEAEVNQVLSYMNIDQKELVDFHKPYYWKKVSSPPGDDDLYLIYQANGNYLYVIELFL